MTPAEYIAKNFKAAVSVDNPIKLRITRDFLGLMFADLGFKKGVEVGVHRGYFATTLCKLNPGLSLVAVDTWPKDDIYIEAKQRLRPLGVILMQMESQAAAELIPNSSLDFVYIDADHLPASIRGDLGAWPAKVRPGGIVAGHDYCRDFIHKNYGVIEAVSEFTKNAKIPKWFITAAEAVPSWFWVSG